jgi:hypothetical protein
MSAMLRVSPLIRNGQEMFSDGEVITGMKRNASLEAPHRFSKMPVNIIEQNLRSLWRQSGASCIGSYPAKFRSGWLSYRLPFRPLAFPSRRLGSRMGALPFPAKIMPAGADRPSNAGDIVAASRSPSGGPGLKLITSSRRLMPKGRLVAMIIM